MTAESSLECEKKVNQMARNVGRSASHGKSHESTDRLEDGFDRRRGRTESSRPPRRSPGAGESTPNMPNMPSVYKLVTWLMQVSLLRAHAGEHLLLSLARRSLPYHDLLLLANDTVLPRRSQAPPHASASQPAPGTGPAAGMARLTARILDELVTPLRDLQIDDTELACLKTIVFFDPRIYVRLMLLLLVCRWCSSADVVGRNRRINEAAVRRARLELG